MAKPTDSKQALGLAKGLSIDADYFAGASVALLGKRGAGRLVGGSWTLWQTLPGSV